MGKQLRSLITSFRVAFYGIRYSIRNERNLRIHLSISLGVLLLSLFYDFSRAQYAVLLLLICLMVSAELFNTAIERVVDLLSPSYNHLAKLAKDTAAGAVLVCAIGAAVIGCVLFLEPIGLQRLLAFAQARPVVLSAGIAAYLTLAAGFIFLPEKKTGD